MSSFQPGILAPIPAAGCYLFFSVFQIRGLRASLRALSGLADGREVVVGIGASLLKAFDTTVDGLHAFPASRLVPSTPAALWCWVRGDDRGEVFHRAREIERLASPAFRLTRRIDAFRHGRGLDLTGYEDGTENPKGAAARKAALVAGKGRGLDGSSFVAVQQWLHDFGAFGAMTPNQRDNAIGRRRRDNVELKHAPRTAHVKRTAQEDFDPPAFLLRRSMPWTEGQRAGLVFVAFGSSLYPFEAQLRRMTGAEDGARDALFRFTRPITGSYFWCPPLRGRRLDLTTLGL